MDKVFHEPPSEDLTPKRPVAPGLCPTKHKEFNEYIKAKGMYFMYKV